MMIRNKATRAKTPRVRTGCITCKQRRLKCDERKPICQRCAAAHQVCGGYEVAPTRKPRRLGTRYRVTTPETEELIPYGSSGILSSGLLNDISELPVYMDLFHYARTVTLEDLETALSPTDFWYSYVLPLGHTVEAVKYAICALGAAHRVFKSQGHTIHPNLDEIRTISVQQYSQAIRCVQSVMETATEQDMQIILTCCIVFISIENLHGRYAESLRHLRAGTSLLLSLRSKKGQSNDFLDIFTVEEPNDGVSNRPEFLDDLAQVLCRLGNDVWGYVRETIAPDLNFEGYANTGLLHHQTSFHSIKQAEESFHSVAKLIEADRIFLTREMMNLIRDYRGESPTIMPSKIPAHHHLVPFDELKAIFNNWSECFDRFRLRFDESNATSQEILRTRALAVDQALWSGWLNCEEWSDYRNEDYEEILRRAESLVASDAFQTSPVFTFDGSLILCLTLPCVLSMDCDIQWRAIRLLRSFWRREGIWDSQELADILEAMMMARSMGLVTKDMLPWDVPHLAKLMNSLQLEDVRIPQGPLLLI